MEIYVTKKNLSFNSAIKLPFRTDFQIRDFNLSDLFLKVQNKKAFLSPKYGEEVEITEKLLKEINYRLSKYAPTGKRAKILAQVNKNIYARPLQASFEDGTFKIVYNGYGHTISVVGYTSPIRIIRIKVTKIIKEKEASPFYEQEANLTFSINNVPTNKVALTVQKSFNKAKIEEVDFNNLINEFKEEIILLEENELAFK